MRLLVAIGIVMAATSAAGAEPPPKGPHPRLFLDDKLRSTWKSQIKQGGAVSRAIATCGKVAGDGGAADRDKYMGFDWSGNVQACLVAWAATGNDAHARTAMRYFVALLDDLETVGDGKGGDATVRRDHGYAIRLIGPTAALAYDWLHDHPAMTDAIRTRARQRFQAWTDWYAKDGYRPRTPSTNYHAGYVVAASLIAIAEAGEAGAAGDALWNKVVDEMWRGDMGKALGSGVLIGGDWGEGWQYAPLSVAGYALAARALTHAGVKLAGVPEWLTALVVRHAHALTPKGGVFVGGDTDDETAYLAPNALTMVAVLVGDATAEAQSWARAELDRLRPKASDEFVMYFALAEAREVKPVAIPRAGWPTWYLAKGTGNLYARTQWGDDAVWTVMQCSHALDIDHFHYDAGNLVLSRGADDVIVDPSPYGSMSTLTSNAPTVESAQLPADYKPGQGGWAAKTRWTWAHQTKSGAVVARCDYADSYKFQDRPSDVPAAQRDLVLVPWNQGRDASVVVIDRARTGARARGLHLRFRTTGALRLAGDVATATVGATDLAIRRMASSSGTPALGKPTLKDCFKSMRGNCDAARFPVMDVRMVVDGPDMEAVHVIDATGKGAAPAARLDKGTGWQAVWLDHKDAAAMVVYARPGATTLTYRAPARPALHVIVDAPADAGGTATVTATARDGGCEVTIKPGGPVPARPAVVAMTASCAVTADPVLAGGPAFAASSATGTSADQTGADESPGGGGPTGPRSGCCGAQAASDSSIAMALIVLAALRGRRRQSPVA